jgi:hypothetical protein
MENVQNCHNYHLFPALKTHLGGTHFSTGEELKEEVFSYLRGAAGEFYESVIKKMVHRMLKYIDLNGGYVEK